MVLISAGLTIALPLITRAIFDKALFPAAGQPNMGLLTELVLLTFAIVAAAAAIGIVQTWLTTRVGSRVMGDLRVQLYERLQTMEVAFFTRTKTGVIQSRLQNDVGGVSNVLTNTVGSVLGNSVTVGASIIAMAILSWQLTLVALILMPIMAIVQQRIGQMRARIATSTQESLSRMTAITQESLSISGILLSKSFGRQKEETDRYAKENQEQIQLQIREAMSGQGFFAVVTVFFQCVPAIVYFIAGWLMSDGNAAITAGTVIAFTTVQARLTFPLLGLMRSTLDLQTSGALFARIFEYLDLRPAIVDAPNAKEVDLTQLGRVAFDDVSFRYSDAPLDASPTLHDISFSIEPGQFVAFVGPSGAGKSTVANLIPRFQDATSGSVRFAGTDVKQLQQASLLSPYRHRQPGNLSLPRHHRRESALRQTGRHPGRDRSRRPRRLHPRRHHELPRWLRHHRRRARPPPLRRRKATHRHRAHLPQGPRRPDPRRSHQRARYRRGSPDPDRARCRQPGPHHHRHRPPALHHPRRRPDLRPRPRPHRRTRHP